MTPDFNAFTQDITWYTFQFPVKVSSLERFSPSVEFQKRFPSMSSLLAAARVTRIKHGDKENTLFAWTTATNEICGWICERSSNQLTLLTDHSVLTGEIGGILESFGAFDATRINSVDYNVPLTGNMNWLFCPVNCTLGVDWMTYYSELARDQGLPVFDYSKYVAFTREANGSQTLYEPLKGKVVVFSHDHASNFLKTLPDHPEYTMHSIKRVETFRDYVELLAQQWLAMIG